MIDRFSKQEIGKQLENWPTVKIKQVRKGEEGENVWRPAAITVIHSCSRTSISSFPPSPE